MPRAKKSIKTSRKVPQDSLTKAYESELSYETRTVIVILLLLFFYPIGLIFMWWWMYNWPVWLKLIISLPLVLGILAFFGFILFVGSLLTRIRIESRIRNRWYPQYVTITPAPTRPVTLTPTTTSVTY